VVYNNYCTHNNKKDIREIDFARLRDVGGARGIVFDKDNCLTLPYALEPHPDLRPAWDECRRVFGDACVIFSNHAGSRDDAGGAAAASIERALQVRPHCGPAMLAAAPLSLTYPHNTFFNYRFGLCGTTRRNPTGWNT
jgi:hypothetical protein